MPSPPLRAGLSPPHRLVDPLPRGGYYRPVSSGSNALRSHPRAPGEVFIGVSPPNVSVGTPGGLIPSHRGAIRPLTFVSAAAGSWRSLAPSSALLAAASGRPGCNTLRASRPPPGCNTLAKASRDRESLCASGIGRRPWFVEAPAANVPKNRRQTPPLLSSEPCNHMQTALLR